MSEDTEITGPAPGSEPARRGRGQFRRWVFPLVVIGAIIAAIWWIDYRPHSDSSATGERYGPVQLPANLVPAGAKVKAEAGGLAPDFLLGGLEEGAEYRLSDFRGRPVVLNFWATWCAPCRKEIPQLVQAYNAHKDEGLVVIGLNQSESASIVQPYADKFGMDFPIAIDVDGELWDRYHLVGLPTTFFIDRDGFVRSVFIGPFVEKSSGKSVQGAIEDSELERRIAGILAVPEGG